MDRCRVSATAGTQRSPGLQPGTRTPGTHGHTGASTAAHETQGSPSAKGCLVFQGLIFHAFSHSLYSLGDTYFWMYSLSTQEGRKCHPELIQSLPVSAARHCQRVHQTYVLGVPKVPISVAVSPTARGRVKYH